MNAAENDARGERMSYYYLRKLLKRLVEKAGIKKDVRPYLFRHITLTSLTKVFSEACAGERSANRRNMSLRKERKGSLFLTAQLLCMRLISFVYSEWFDT